MICLVTDRRRRDVVRQTAAAAAAGIDLVQIRERDLEGGPLLHLVTAVVGAAAGSATRVVVNDRLDVAVAGGADGVHLRGDSFDSSAVRAVVQKRALVGRSVHSREEAERAAPHVDYLIAGTVFPTASKSDSVPLLGLDGLRSICRAVAVPVLAIGGMTLEALDEVAAAGAAGVAGIGWFDGATDFEAIVAAVRTRFDSARLASYHRHVFRG